MAEEGTSQAPKRKRSRLWRWLRFPVYAALLLAAVPGLLVPLYLVVPPVSVPMLERMLRGQPVTRDWQDIDTISDRLKAAIVMSEDGQFCRHWGVDVGALRAEINAWRAGEEPRGASTITMQVARNLFLWNDRSFVRKAIEVPLAIYVDLILPKRRIMEIYLNIAEWGPDGEFGVAAGAARAFGQDPAAFTWRQASLLAVTLPNPLLRDPAHPGAGLGRVASVVERRARRAAPFIDCLYQGEVPPLD